MSLKYPWLLLLFLVYLPLIAWYIAKYKKASPSVGMSTLSAVAKLRIGVGGYRLSYRSSLSSAES